MNSQFRYEAEKIIKYCNGHKSTIAQRDFIEKLLSEVYEKAQNDYSWSSLGPL